MFVLRCDEMKVKSLVEGSLEIQGGFIVPELDEIFEMSDQDAERHIAEGNVEAA